MKTLRGKKSEDEIFSGSEKKGKMSMAKVSLIFDNADKKIPLEFNEVIITRKLYRNGESEYLINDSQVRLLDIFDILAQTGIGKESYCVVGQGMTDAILNATPQERRIMIVSPKVQVYGDVAILSYNFVGVSLEKDGSTSNNTAKSTRVYAKVGGQWKLVHANFAPVLPPAN